MDSFKSVESLTPVSPMPQITPISVPNFGLSLRSIAQTNFTPASFTTARTTACPILPAAPQTKTLISLAIRVSFLARKQNDLCP